MAFILKNETEFMSGESECQCGGSDFSVIDIGPFVANLQTVEASSFDEDENKDDDFDWCRPNSDDSLDGDYNNVFDDDPGFGK